MSASFSFHTPYKKSSSFSPVYSSVSSNVLGTALLTTSFKQSLKEGISLESNIDQVGFRLRLMRPGTSGAFIDPRGIPCPDGRTKATFISYKAALLEFSGNVRDVQGNSSMKPTLTNRAEWIWCTRGTPARSPRIEKSHITLSHRPQFIHGK